MADTGPVTYLVLADRAVPYLLARVRWPDIAQAISAASPDWLDDPGLFDLPYDPSSVTLSFPQAASVAAGWGRRLHAEPAEDVPSYLRRMPANWSDLSPSELRTWGIEFVGRRHPRRRLRLPRPVQAKLAGSSTAVLTNRKLGALAGPGGDAGTGVNGSAADGSVQVAAVTSGLGSVSAECRHHPRIRLDGHAHIRCEHTTISAGIVDLSEGGVACVLPDAPAVVTPDAMLSGPFLLETDGNPSRICLDVAGRISWNQRTGEGTHFGVAFGELAEGEAEGVQRFLAAAKRKRGRR